MISDEALTVTLEEAIENQLLRSGNPAAAASGTDGNTYWATMERNVAAEDYTPLLGLVAELRDKIIGLTPRRRDLAAETCEAMDVELLEQMMAYGAFDVVRAVFVGRAMRIWSPVVHVDLRRIRLFVSNAFCLFEHWTMAVREPSRRQATYLSTCAIPFFRAAPTSSTKTSAFQER